MNYKICNQCSQQLPRADFYSSSRGVPFARCKPCCIAERRARYLADPERDKAQTRARLLADPRVRMAASARRRDHAKGLPSDIEATQISIPRKCPVLGLPLSASLGKHHPGSPSIDHIDPTRGAVQGNWRVISYRANALKGTHTAATLAEYIRRIEHPDQCATKRRTDLRGSATLEEYRAVLRYIEGAPAS
jgi:hypothetical protein